jgi:hypothetical protein
MDTLTPIVALVVGLYDMVSWREVLIGVGIVLWLGGAAKILRLSIVEPQPRGL